MPTSDRDPLEALLQALEDRQRRTSKEEELRERLSMQLAMKTLHKRVEEVERTLADLGHIDKGLDGEVKDREALGHRVKSLERDRTWASRTLILFLIGVLGWWLKNKLGL